MKLQVSRILFLLLAATVFVSAQTAQLSDQTEANLRKHVEYLASDKLEGRRTGEQGATFAAGYVANAFAQSKLKPGFKNAKGKSNFLQPFPYVAGTSLGKDNFLRIIPTDSTRENKMQPGVNWMPLGFSPSADIPASPLVFAGYGIVSTESKHDDYAGLDVRDKIVLILDGTPDAANPHSQFARFNIHTKASIAKEKGVRALVVIASDPDFKNDRLSALTYDRTLGETAVPALGIARDHGAQLLGADLAAIEKSVAAGQKIDSPALVKAVAQIKIVLEKRIVEAYNVIGILEGSDPMLKNEAIIIGAHYDHLGKGGQGSLVANSTDIHHGADDNASGTSAVLELARQFAKQKGSKRTVIFMSFGGEEEGLLGSKYYVNNPVWPLDTTVAMINLDMVGRLNENKLTIGGVGTATEWRATLAMTNAVLAVRHAAELDKNAGFRPFESQLNDDGFGPSDHSSFYSKQIPVLFFFTGTHLDYHKPSDTFEKINYDGLTKITSYVAAITKSIDENPTRPTYKVAQSSGTGGRMAFSVSLGTIPSYADSTDGLVLDGVRDNSPAAKAGIKAGDKITKLAGKDVRNAMDYTYVLSTMKAGEEYEVVLIRGTETLTLKIVPAPAARRP